MAVAQSPVLSLIPSHEETLLREGVAGTVSKFGHDYSIRKTEAGEPPTELWDALAEKGYLGANLPEEYGGGGMGMAGLAAVGEEITRGGCSLLLIVVSPAIAGSILVRHGTEEQKDVWLRGIAAGTTRVAFAITEPDAGSNSHQLKTSARKDGDRWILNGQKTFISAIEHADAVLVIARRKEADGSLGLPLLFLVDVDAPGFTRQHVPTALRSPDKQWQLFFDDVEIPADRLIGSETGGLAAVFDGLNPERIMGAAISIGAAERALEQAAAYARERDVWGQPIGAHQGIAHPLAECKIELELARLMAQKACALYDAGISAGEACNMAKYAAAEAAIRCVDQAIQTHGGNGVALEYGLSDMWWGVRLSRIAPVSREMILNHVAQHSLGLPKSY